MKGLYLYCIRARGANNGKISAIPFKDIEAVVSDINPSRFNGKEITEKNIRRHHDVIAEAYQHSVVIPMKFGTIFKTRKSLEAMLKKHYRKFKRLLAELAGKQEWGVKIYLEHEKFVEFLKKENKEVKKLSAQGGPASGGEKSTMSEGMRWYADKKIEESIAAQFEEEVENQLQVVVKRLEDCCGQVVLCDILPKEAMEAGKDNIFNAACLVDNSKLDYFKKLLQEMRKEYDQIGATLVTTGPWPPYNFVQLNEKN